MYIDTQECGSNWIDVYRLCATFIQPRPIALVSSVSANGVRNVAPFSLYNLVSANPPVVFFGPSRRRDKSEKDTLHNVEQTGEFVVATVVERIADQMNQCAAEYAPDVDEFEKSGLTPKAATLVKPALVSESPVNIECKLMEVKRFGTEPGSGAMVLGRIVAIHVDDDVLAEDGWTDPKKLQALGRLGRNTYCKTSDLFDLVIPKVE